MAVTGLFTAMTPEKANAAEWEACDIPVIKDVSEFDAVSAMYSKTITVTKKDKNIEQGYGSFQLKSDNFKDHLLSCDKSGRWAPDTY